MPLLFVSHGAPTTALEKNDAFARDLRRFAEALPKPEAIVIVSAHWQTRGLSVTATAEPETIHDFGGFARELYDIRYPAPGAPAVARRIAALTGAQLDERRGLDHGAWTPLVLAWPAADLPVVQVSLPRHASAEDLLKLGAQLSPLRDEGVLLVGSGAATHNLSRVDLGDKEAPPESWARMFDQWLGDRVQALDLQAFREWRELAPGAAIAHPTSEHFDPVLVVLGATRAGDRPRVIHESFQYGNLSMRTFAIEPNLTG